MSKAKKSVTLPGIPIGLSNWNELRARNYMAVDKTALIHDLVKNNTKIFISKPRRFGKTMLVSMLQELFTNGDQNFEGTAIYGNWPEQGTSFPVIRISFITVACNDVDKFEQNLRDVLVKAYKDAGFSKFINDNNIGNLELNQALTELSSIANKIRLVFLIDEWDYPLSFYLNDEDKFERIRKVLHNFYNWLRDQQRVRFILITGIMRYKETNVFTGKDIVDLSMNPKYAPLLGYSQDDILKCFAPYIKKVTKLLGIKKDELIDELTYLYDGFCFEYNAKIKMYNPWSINSFFQQAVEENPPIFGNFWIGTAGDPQAIRSFMQRIKPKYSDIANILEGDVEISYDSLALPKLFSMIDIGPLLTLNGYLSIKVIKRPVAYNPTDRTFICGLANNEVKLGFAKEFMQYAVDTNLVSSSLEVNLQKSIEAGNVASICTYLNETLSDFIFDEMANASETTYRTLIAAAIHYCKYNVREETQNRSGRSDIEIDILDDNAESVEKVFVLELKLIPPDQDQDSSAVRQKILDAAQKQVLSHGYGVNRFTHGKHVTGIILVISPKYRQIVAWRKIDDALANDTHTEEGSVQPLNLLNNPVYQTQP